MITRWLGIGALVLGGWIAVLAGTMLASGDAPAALVLFPGAGFVDRLPEGVTILSYGPVSVTVGADAGTSTAALYRAGGRLVLPAGLAGCFGGAFGGT